MNVGAYLVIRRRSRKLGDPRRRGIDGDRDERLKNNNFFLSTKHLTFIFHSIRLNQTIEMTNKNFSLFLLTDSSSFFNFHFDSS